ncbi:MAG: hypothetical protein KDD44_13175, partial [Bdellovibrionales bacterium]|nr:hypothetical protein [Bdellovibrionales bacterium]
QRNVITYELSQSLWGRFDDRNPYVYGLEEVAPEVEDLGALQSLQPLDETFGGVGVPLSGSDVLARRGLIRELARFTLSQSYDVLESRNNDDPGRSPLADLGGELLLLPNEYVNIRALTNFDVEETEFRSYGIEGQLRDKRGDEVRSRLTYIEDRVRQLESSVEVRVTERAKVGYYTRYDDLSGEFIENRVGMRFASGCNCWLFDVIFSDESNPDRTQFGVTLTLVGLGEFGNSLYSR